MSETQDSMSLWLESSQLSGSSSAYLDAIYEDYLKDPNLVDSSWRQYFDGIRNNQHDVSHAQIREDFIALSKNPFRFAVSTPQGIIVDSSNYPDGGDKISAVMDLVYMYRSVGHKIANLDPLGIKLPEVTPELDLEFHGLNKENLNESFNVGIFSDYKPMLLKDIIAKLKQVYADSVGYEFMHLSNMAEKMWFRQRVEKVAPNLSKERKEWLLERLTAAEGLEKYLGMKYVGQKRFSLEGGESMIPALNEIINKAGEASVEEVGMGMAHRGRLNVLVNIMGKSPENLFKEFEGEQDKKFLSGDVKYHLGFASWHKTPKETVRLALAFNPSHLETVDPVVEGAVRAKQDCFEHGEAPSKVVPILIHGDSAFCGQGVIMETFSLSQTRYYGTGGTIHIVINNQVGFTTDKKEDNRSSLYCTDIAKMVEAPVLHVNADDPEAVVRVAGLAMDYRMMFNKDIVIDLVCYRRHGHNEADEPSGTQPKMYSIIKKLPTTRAIYAEKLEKEGVVSQEQADVMAKAYRDKLQNKQVVADVITTQQQRSTKCIVNWRPYLNQKWDQRVDTRFDKEKLIELANKLNHLPEGLILQPQVKKTIEDRVKMAAGESTANWGFAENLAYATLLVEGYSIRLSGEDCGRGTFSHRHAVLHNYDYNNVNLPDYIPLQHINPEVQCHIIDSVLSEYAVLGFDYGYSCSAPESLVIWEAQFGDFANTAQVVIDQFIAAAEEKWGILSGLVMLLPHGQEGQGAEHSSARLERFLQLCANDNMQICVPTTPAQLFHMLRRQMLRAYRKPLIVMSPKSLLRHPLVFSSLEDLADGHFYNVIHETDDIKAEKITRVILCSGKVYYDLLSKRREKAIEDIAIIRIEQLYPFPQQDLEAVLAAYQHVSDIVWVQEEPENQGAWWMIQHELRRVLVKGQSLNYVGRKAAAAPAVGYPALFHIQQDKLIGKALKLDENNSA
ncbi:2-oxoglutarate dehydrogenase E1 component [Fastidiosibacter lacustris]|uniref:2-oxoglutarate dehydrogenase E1 component n=1 Tax=Fastidiosibacter lacustris TaxID=2056695 RepID=UPI000E34B635|nr:2-oxoglutarate dehydrogenase E1 component [Fastidiosibacter lacustris]